jgi:hypothetical protein
MIKRKSTNCATNIAQNPPAWRRQLDLFPHQGNRHKPQISSISAISPKEPHRYRVTLAGQVLGDRAIKQHLPPREIFPYLPAPSDQEGHISNSAKLSSPFFAKIRITYAAPVAHPSGSWMKRSPWQVKAPTCKPLLKSKLGLEGANGI